MNSKTEITAALDPGFIPLSLVWKKYQHDVSLSGTPGHFICAIERGNGLTSPWEADIFPEGQEDERTVNLLERIVKSLLWIRGGYRIKIFGCKALFEKLKNDYTSGGARSFDAGFMSDVYEKPFEVLWVENRASIDSAVESKSAIGRHLDGCRIGFDAGGSDRKVSSVVDGNVVFSEEVVWFPKINEDPDYHYEGILSAMKKAASQMPRVDAIGVSSAGIYINNQIMAASLFLKVEKDLFDAKVKNMYIDIAKEIADVPLIVANDGDVTALAGAMSLDAGNVLGIAMGTSEAGGYVDHDMHIMGWLNELAFVPVDYNPQAMIDEWSGDYGCGVKYFSQDAVIKLAPAANIHLDETLSPAEKLKIVQSEMEKGNPEAIQLYETIGVYFGYAIAFYSLFYKMDHVLIMGRVTSGEGGALLLNKAQKVLENEFPEISKSIQLHIPDEKNRRIGQSVAAASLPQIK